MKFIRLFLVLTLLFQQNILAVTYGSDTAVSIVNPMNIPTATDNIIKTFAAAKNGFAFQDLRTSCSWQSIYPVAGPISLKGGKLYLMSDLTLNNTGTLADLGTIIGANHVVELSQYNTTFNSGTQPNGKLILNTAANLTLTKYSRSFDWSYDGKYLAVGEPGGTGNELYVYEFTGASLVLRASLGLGGTANANSVRWQPSSYFIAVTTSATPFIRSYQFTPPSTLTARGTVAGTASLLSVAWQARGTHVAVGGTTATGISVYSYNTGTGAFSLIATSTNSAALGGTVQYDSIHWAPTGNKNDIIASTYSSATVGTLHLYNFTGAALNHLKAYSQGKGAYSLDWAPTSTYMALGFSDGTLRTYEHTAATNIIKQKQSYTLANAINSVNWKYDASELAVARAYSATAGVSEFQIYSFDPATYTMLLKYPLDLTTDAYCTRYYYNSATQSSYVARSDNATRLFIIYKESYSPFIMQDVNLFLNGDLTLSAPLSFMGNCSINGRNNRITFTSNGSLSVSPNSNLQISLANLKFTTPGAFSLEGQTANILLKNSKIELNSDIFLTDGKLDIYDDLTITGPHTFGYESPYTSTIHAYSKLLFDNGATFQIGKTRATTIEPLQFEDSTAELNFNNATLHSTNSGLGINRGTVNIYGNSAFNIDWTDQTVASTMQGIKFGDGINAGNDPWLKLNGNGTRLTFLNGAVISDCVSTHSWLQFLGQSQLAVVSTATMYIKRPTEFTNGWILSDTTVQLNVANNAYLKLDNTRITGVNWPGDETVTGTLASAISIILDTNDKFTVLSGPAFTILQVINEGNTISGNGNFVGAILFASANSQLTWDLPSQILSSIALNGGRLSLTQNTGFILGNSFLTTGSVDLGTQALELGTRPTTWSGNLYWIGDGAIIRMNNDITLDGIWTVSGSVTIEGNGYSMDLGTSGTIILERGAQLTFNNFALYNMSRQTPIVCKDNNCLITMNFTDLILSGDFLFDKGSIYTYYDSIIMPAATSLDTMFTFSYASTQPSTIDSDASLAIWPGIKFSIGRQDSTINDPAQQPLIFLDPMTSRLILNGGTLHVTSSGMIMTYGTLDIANSSALEIETPKYEYGLVLGDGTTENDFEININAGGLLTLKSGKIYYNNYSDNRMVFGSQESTLAIETQEGLVAKTNLTLGLGAIATPLPNDTALGRGENTYVIYQNLHRYDYGHTQDFYLTGTADSNPLPLSILDSNDSLLLNPGTYNRNILIKQYGNKISGVGNISGGIEFTDWRSTLTWDLNQPYSSGDIDLKGGRIIYTQDSGIGPQYSFKGSGTIDLTTKTLQLGTVDTTWTGNFYWIGDNAIIRMNNDITLDGTWTISGNITVEGNGYSMDLGTTGTIILERGAQLTFNNFALYNITRQNGIFCSDNNCLITLNFVDLILAGDFLFDKGSIYTYYDSIIMPSTTQQDTMFTFSYASTQPSTIDSDASLAIWPGIRFSIGRQDSTITNAAEQPLIFLDPMTSRLILNGGTLHVTSSGMIMTYGTLDVADSSAIEVDTPKYEYGLILGDGTAENDFVVNVNAGIQLTLKTGKLYYNNYANNRIVLNSPASVLAIESNQGLVAKNDLMLSSGSFASPDPNDIILEWEPGVYVTANNVHRYDYSHINDFYVTGTLNPPLLILDSNDQILTNPGTFSRNITIKQGGNQVTGIGTITGSLNFTDYHTTLSWDIPQIYTAGDIDLKGGKIIYTKDSGLSNGYSFIGTGTVDISNQTFQLGLDATTWHGNLYWIGAESILVLNNNVTIDGTWTISGDMTIQGNNYLIDLAPTGSIILERGAHLTLKDMSLYNLSRTNRITCKDNNCQIILNIADLLMANDYLWDKGSIYTYYNSNIGLLDGLDGLFTFSYATTVPATIDSYAFLKIKQGARLSIGRPNSTITDVDQQPLLFVDPITSKLILDGGTLHITSSGMIMTKGILNVANSSDLEIENTAYPYGLILGDGTADNDFKLALNAGNLLTLKSGRLFYNNNANDRIVFDSPESNLAIELNNGLYAKKDLNITQGTLSTPLTSNVPVGRDPNINIVYENVHRYDYSHLLDFYITGTARVIPTPATILDSNDRLLINPGNFDRPIVIKQYGNSVAGVGNISGNIEFTNWRSTLTWDLNQNYAGGDIDLKGGRIIYTKDSGIGPQYSFKGSGTIDLTTKVLELGTVATTWVGNLYWMGDGATIVLNNNVTIDGTWTLSGNITIAGNNYLIDLAPTGSIILERGAQITFKDFSVYDMSRQNPITCNDNNCTIIMSVADFILSGDYLWDKGSIFVYYNSTIGILDGLDGIYTFSYVSTQSSTIDSSAFLKVKPNTRLSIGRVDSSITDIEQQPLIFVDPATSQLIIDGGTLHITSSGMIMTKGKIQTNNASSMEIENSAYPYGLVLGDGTLANDFELNIGGGYELALKSGSIFYNNNSPNRVVFGSPASSIDIKSSNGFYAKRDLTLKDGSIYTSGSSSIAISKDPGVDVIQENILRYYTLPYYSVQRRNVHGVRPYVMNDGDYYYITEGYTTNDVIAYSGTSSFGGSGRFAGTLTLNNPSVTLQSNLDTPLLCNVALNGGTFVVQSDGYFGGDKTFTGSGKIQLQNTKLAFGPTTDMSITNTIYWQAVTNGGITLSAQKTSLSGTWTVGGNIVLNGNGNILDLSNHGQLTIRPNSTLSLENISVKGLGTNYGSINFMDDTATLRLSNAYLELDNNMSTTIGGIIVNGPSTVGLKNFNWTLDQNASMTVDGVTLWQDPLDKNNYGKITFGAGAQSKYLSLISSGTIKTDANLDMLTSSSTLLQTQIKNNSNAIIKLDRTVRTNSNAFAYGIKNNSNSLLYLNRTTSNALRYGDRTNSNAIILLDRKERTDSNALLYLNRTTSNALRYGDRTNSNAIILLDRKVRTDSNALLYLNRTTSNALRYGDRTNSNAIVYLDRKVRTDSNAFAYGIKNTSNTLLYLNRTTSNALRYGDRTNSNAIIKLDRTERTNSNAFAYGIKNNSNAIINLGNTSSILPKQNSNAIVSWIKQTSNTANYLSTRVRTDSNALMAWGKQTSNATNYLSTRVRTDSNALLYLNRTTSNALLYGDKTNSNAIIKLGVTERTNSNAFAYGIKNNSNALLYGNRTNSNAAVYLDRRVRTDSNALLYLNRTTSNALLYGNRTNSNAIIKLDRTERTNSNAFAYGIKNNSNAIVKLSNTTGALSVNNSNAIILLDRKERTDSNAMLYLNRTTSNALLYGDRTNSNAIIKLDRTERTNSNAFAYGIKNNSNAIINLGNTSSVLPKQNSNAIVSWIKQTSNTANYLSTRVRTDSNALMAWGKQTSNATNYLSTRVRTDSNALLYLNRTTSNALLYGDKTNSNSIIKLDRTERTNSNAFAYGIKNNSNAIVSLTFDDILTHNNSNAIVLLDRKERTDSNAMLYLNRTTSNALLYGDRTNSNAIVYLKYQMNNNSTSVVALNQRITNNSNAIIKNTRDIRNNSNAIIKLAADAPTALVINSSNAINSLANHFVSVGGAKFYVMNSISGNTTLNGISMLEHSIDLNGGTLTLNADLMLSSQSRILSSGNLNLNGHAIIFDGDQNFANNVTVKVISSGILDGRGNSLDIANKGKLIVDNGITLTLKNLNLSSESSWPIEMRSPASSLVLHGIVTVFERDFTFTQGKLFFHEDVLISGSNKFSYASTSTSYIDEYATLYFDMGTTFSYSPRISGRHTQAERNLIKMADRSSNIVFDQCNIKLPDSGWQLTRGSLYFDNKVTLTSGYSKANSFEWGDGTSVGDISVNLLAGANIKNYGCIYYNPPK